MARKIIDTGVVGNDGTGDSIRDSFRKVNDNFRELYSSLGLGDRLTFGALTDLRENISTDSWFELTNGQPYFQKANFALAVNQDASGVTFKELIPGNGIGISHTSQSIRISSDFTSISADTSPQLGGDLEARSGGEQFRILQLPPYNFNTFPPGGPTNRDEATSKSYADSKISRAGVNAIDPETNSANPTFGTMTGPLILSRNPVPEDDEVYGGLIAATKSYVDNAGFGSKVNLYVATSGADDRVGVSRELQGRALSYAYRTLEAALKRAEEIVNESRLEIGPYKKTLTYNNGLNQCTLERIESASTPTIPFSGIALMSIKDASLSSVGVNYNVGDIITVVGGTFEQPARFQVLSTANNPGAVVTFRVLSSGVYSDLPGSVIGSQRIVSTTATDALGQVPPRLPNGVQLSVSFEVNNIEVLDGGSGYGLVSVRVIGGGGAGAFGTADVIDGVIRSITVTDRGTGFINLPTVLVNLPRFKIKTEDQRTDFTGDVTSLSPGAAKNRDIREGLFLRGETSGALAQILAHAGDLDDDGNEIFDVDVVFGTFQDAESFGVGEVISYGDVAKQIQITVLVESGIYEEHLPLRVPANVSIVGDEFRRVIIRPKPGISSSPWAFLKFRRDLTIGTEETIQSEFNNVNGAWTYEVLDGDLLTITGPNVFGYHYLQNTTEPVYPLINNKGFYRAAAELLTLNRSFLQQQVVNWIDDQVANNIAPFSDSFTYYRELCQRDIGLIIDSIVFDLKYGGQDRTISAALKYKGSASELGDPAIAIGVQLEETIAGIRRLNTLAQLVIKNVEITELYEPILNSQIIDRAFRAETGTVGSSINISSITNAAPAVFTTSENHGLTSGDEILISGVDGMTEFNGNNYYVEVFNATQFGVSEFTDLEQLVDSSEFDPYTANGTITTPGGVVGALIDAVIDIIDTDSESYNLPKNNDQMDMFLANDAVRWQAITGQGHGGFMMVLDPMGQILAKSPYAQECASFSKSTGRQTFAGGMFIDGFAGNLRFKLLERESGTFLRVGNLTRRPQLPASFIVQDTVYRINYVRDFVFDPEGSTASFVLDEVTPWPFEAIEYNDDICFRDVGLIVDGLGYDIVFGTNYHARKSGLSYRQANAAVVVQDQLDITARAIAEAHRIARITVSEFGAGPLVDASSTTIVNIVRNGSYFAPSLNFTNPPGVSSSIISAKSLLQSNISFIRDETIGWINAQIAGDISPFSSSFTYNSIFYSSDIGRIIESVIYDVLYGGNSQSRSAAFSFYDGVGDAITLQLDAGELNEFAAAVDYANYLAQQVVQNLAPAVTYSSTARVTGTAASSTEVDLIEDLIDIISNVVVNGVSALPAEELPNLDAYAYSTDFKNARTALVTAKTNIQTQTVTWVDDNINVFEVLMPGNRSMLSNDFTQIDDMGYGLFVTNGGLAEAVSMFTYYCYISYYSLNGGQIRSVGGSSAHGVYALVAEGADPLEVPTPVSLYHDLSQGAECYFPNSEFANTADGVTIFVTNYTYVPLANSELEIEFDNLLFRYKVTSVSTTGLPAGVARLNLSSNDDGPSDGVGLEEVVNDGTKLTIRQNSQVVLTGDIVDVATRPSTGLILNESSDVYRVLKFDAYDDPAGARTCTISNSNPAFITRVNHQLGANYQIEFATTGILPAGITAGTVYFILPDNLSDDSFQISTSRNGTAIATTSNGSGTHSYTVYGLADTQLRENYNYVDITVWADQPFKGTPDECLISEGSPAEITLEDHGFNVNDVVKFAVSGGGTLPAGITSTRMYFVDTVINDDTFTISSLINGNEIITSSPGSGTFFVGLVTGAVGDIEFAVVPVGPEESRILGTKFVLIGEEYTVTGYDNEVVTNAPYALVRLSKALVNSVLKFNSLPTLKSAAPKGEPGTLTIRISLTRVTSHDLLEIGTGSYADTNYPSEIYGPPVNPINPANETQERGVGRCFYVTTDQFGNFSVGPYFRVDQGTGTVTFSASIALSNLDGIGFKRGVPISEFSIDTGFSDNFTDTVPTESATRGYIERRLGITHGGEIVGPGALIPSTGFGGFMALSGQLAMKANMNLGEFTIFNVGDPVSPQDAVNLRSLTYDNFQNFTGTSVSANQLIVFTGVGKQSVNASIAGDITFTLSGNTFTSAISSGSIINNDINLNAAIAQSKLNMTIATTRDAAPSGSVADKQAASGLASFDSANFEITDGFVGIKANGVSLEEIQTLPSDTVIGNSLGTTGAATAVSFATVVDEGLAIKKSNFNALGFLRRKNPLTPNGNTGPLSSDGYEVIDADSANIASTLVRRDSNGDFEAREINISKLLVDSKVVIDTTASGGGGVVQLYGFSGQAAILLGDGTVTGQKTNFYDNDRHFFRPQNGIGHAPITCSTINASAIVGTGSPNTQMTGTFRLASGSTLHATYADLAEYYEADKEYAVGTVLVFGGEKEVTLTNRKGDHRVAGVVSDNAALIMNEDCQGEKVLVALQGRVPCRVVGKVEKGDLMVTSHIAGVAVSAGGNANAGTIIGKALENFESDHIGTIEVAVGRT
jgi:hypothetical protein